MMEGFGSDLKSGDKVKIVDTFCLVYEKIVDFISPYDAPCLGLNTWAVHFTDGTTLEPGDGIVSYKVVR